MKRSLSILLIVLFVITALAGCGPKQEQIQEEFLAILEKPASEENIKEATEYLDQYLAKLDEEYASYMVHELEHYILEFDQEAIDYEEWALRYEKYVNRR